MPNYLDILGQFFPGAAAHVRTGDQTVYADLVWETSPIAQATLDAQSGSLEKELNRRGTYQHFAFEKQVKSRSFTRASAFHVAGSDVSGVPYSIQVLAYADSGSAGEVRLYDKTNGSILTSATFSNTNEEEFTVPVGAWPTEDFVLEIQIKKTSGNNNKRVYLSSITIEH